MKEKNYSANSVSHEQFSHLWEDKFEQNIETLEENGKKTHIVIPQQKLNLQDWMKKISK